MELIRQWGFSLCVAAVVCSLAQMMAPRTGASKIFPLTLGAFFLCTVLSPALSAFGTLEFTLEWEQSESRMQEVADRLEESVTRDYLLPAGEKAVEEVAEILREFSVTPQKIVPIVNTENSDSIEIYGMSIYLAVTDQNKEGELRTHLQSRLGYPVQFFYQSAEE